MQRNPRQDEPSAELLTVGAVAVDNLPIALRSMETALHDLSQPLTSIALALEILARERDPAAVEAMLVAARQECARAMRDVKTLRIQTNRLLDRTNEAGRGTA